MRKNIHYFISFLIFIFVLVGCQQDASKENNTNKSTTDAANQMPAKVKQGRPGKKSILDEQAPDIVKEVKVNDQYAFRSYKNYDSYAARYEILQNGKIVYSSTAEFSSCNLSGDDLEIGSKFPPLGKDITGEGTPNLVVGCVSGGSHCCTDITIFSLGESLKVIKHFKFGYSTFELIDLDDDGIYELKIADWTFQNWSDVYMGGAAEGSANQDVLLRYKNGDYKIAPDLMKRFSKKTDLPSMQEIAKEFAEGEDYDPKNPANGVSFEMWRYMLDLVYNGKGNEALSFCHKVWPRNRKGERAFIDAFKKQLTKSPYWSGIKELNGW